MTIADTMGLITEIGSQTLVGTSGAYPRASGNCFDVICDGHKQSFKIANFHIENLKKLMQFKMIELPIHCYFISDKVALIADPRVPLSWYQNHFCEVCTPFDLLPLPQQLRHKLKMSVNDIVHQENGMVMHNDSGHFSALEQIAKVFLSKELIISRGKKIIL